MCGIIGYVGHQDVISTVVDSLRRLEYRGYDSAGIAYFSNGKLDVTRSMGKLSALEERLSQKKANGTIGIGHTRWATHGRPSETNAHPHQSGPIVLVHNGIIENYLSLKKSLQEKGRTFTSETDTEVFAQLIDDLYQGNCNLEEAVFKAMGQVRGSYAICVLSEREPDQIIAVRSGCPLVIGVGSNNKELFAASDIPAFLPYTREVVYLNDGEMAILKEDRLQIKDKNRAMIHPHSETVSWDPVMAEKGGYRHFMLKEIYEQPRAIADTILGRVGPENREIYLNECVLPERIDRVVLIACGTSWHAALIGKFMIEGMGRLPVEVDVASEFRYRNPHLTKNDLVIAISQSGETADTLAGVREAKARGAYTLAICNVVGSSLSREANGTLYTHAGPEISVASTKAFTTQVTGLLLLAMHMGKMRGTFPEEERKELVRELLLLPKKVDEVLRREQKIEAMAKQAFRHTDFLYLGRGIQYPVALEGALKLKEVSYIHAEGYPAGEMKHGPIALIDENMPVVFLAPKDGVYEKIVSNMMEVRARGGKVLLFTDDPAFPISVEEVFVLPKVPVYLSPMITAIPLQLLAYHIALLRGSDVDQPRNLAKSVTVE
ncbi:MAG: glutamine--fructose-6-phosphate transaminase (isomerizing) [Nitrospirota bacterium]